MVQKQRFHLYSRSPENINPKDKRAAIWVDAKKTGEISGRHDEMFVGKTWFFSCDKLGLSCKGVAQKTEKPIFYYCYRGRK